MFKKIVFIFSVFILIFSFTCNTFADGGVTGLTWDIPESSDYPNHTYIFIFDLQTGNASTTGVFMLKYYMPVTLLDISGPATYALKLNYVNGLYYKYDSISDTFVPFPTDGLCSNDFNTFFKDSDDNWVHWDDPSAVIGLFPLASNHNIYLDDDTLFFWTIQQNINSPHLYRPQVEAMVKTLLVVGGRTLGIVLAIFGIVLAIVGIVLGISSAKRWIFSFLR